MFAAASRGRRCAVPASGWFEWQRTEGGKVPHAITARGEGAGEDPELLAFAGVWEPPGPASETASVAIITVDASPGLAKVHDRMPAILGRADLDRWLDPEVRLADTLDRLRPHGEDIPLVAFPVSRAVNSPANDQPECIQSTK